MGSGIQAWWWPEKWPKLVTCVINCCVHDGTSVGTFINARLVTEQRLYALQNDRVHYNQRRAVVVYVGLRWSMFSGFSVFCPGVWGNVNAAVVLRQCWCCKYISHPGFFLSGKISKYLWRVSFLSVQCLYENLVFHFSSLSMYLKWCLRVISNVVVVRNWRCLNKCNAVTFCSSGN